jgi:hypothetical protein
MCGFVVSMCMRAWADGGYTQPGRGVSGRLAAGDGTEACL